MRDKLLQQKKDLRSSNRTFIFALNQLELLNRITSRIRQSLEIQEVLDAAVTEVRAF